MPGRFRGEIQYISESLDHHLYGNGTHYNLKVSCPYDNSAPWLWVNIRIENVRVHHVSNFNDDAVENSHYGYSRLRQSLSYANFKGTNNLAQKSAEEIQELLDKYLRIGKEIIVFGTKYRNGIHNVHESNRPNHDGALFVRQQNGGWTAFFFAIDDE